MSEPGRNRPAILWVLLIGGILFAAIVIGTLWQGQSKPPSQAEPIAGTEPLPVGSLVEDETHPVQNIPPPYPIPLEPPGGLQARPENSRDFPPEAEFQRIQEQQLRELRESGQSGSD